MNFNTKAMVLAAGAALAAPGAHAQITSKAGSSWEFYGKFYPELAHASGDNATPAGTTGLSTLITGPGTGVSNGGNSSIVNVTDMRVGNSRVGFRGSKSVGGEMKAIWQVESTVPFNQGGGSTGGGRLGTRDSYLGVAGKWGTLRLGFMDTPFKKAGDVLGFLGISSGNFVSTNTVLRHVGFAGAARQVGPTNTANGPDNHARFHERRGNAIDFASPSFGGVQAMVQYSNGDPTISSVTATRNPRVLSMAVKYAGGPWYFAAMHEIHYDMFGGSRNVAPLRSNDTGVPAGTDQGVNSKDTAVQLTAIYKIGGHSFEADYITKQYSENPEARIGPPTVTDPSTGLVSPDPTGRFQSYKNNAYMAVWEGRWSNEWRTALTYVHANAGSCQLYNVDCSTSGLEGTQMSAGASYYVDPTLYLFGIYSVLKNGASARYNNLGSGRAPATGERITQFAIGLSYNF
jgi:predicted porin